MTSALRLGIGQHAAGLLLEHSRLVQLALDRHVEQRIVGNAAPQEEREPRREFEIADAIRLALDGVRRLALEAEHEPRIDEHTRETLFDAGIEPTGLSGLSRRSR